MLKLLSRWLEAHRQRKAAVIAAVRHFEATTGAQALAGMSCFIGRDPRGAVDRICHGTQVKPPRRVWYVVGPDRRVVAELSFAEARQFGERGWK
jgi:hypothetical protein